MPAVKGVAEEARAVGLAAVAAEVMAVGLAAVAAVVVRAVAETRG